MKTYLPLLIVLASIHNAAHPSSATTSKKPHNACKTACEEKYAFALNGKNAHDIQCYQMCLARCMQGKATPQKRNDSSSRPEKTK